MGYNNSSKSNLRFSLYLKDLQKDVYFSPFQSKEKTVSLKDYFDQI